MSDTTPANANSDILTPSDSTGTESELLVVEVDPGSFRISSDHEFNLVTQTDPLELSASVVQPILAAPPGNPLTYQAAPNVNVDLDIADLGHMNLRLMENDNCKMIDNKLIRLRRFVGILDVLVYAKHLGCGVEVLMRGTLLRANPELRQIPVDFICQRHMNESGAAGRANVLQAGTDPLDRVTYVTHGVRRSVVFRLGYTGIDGTISTSVDFRTLCTDDCNTSNHPRMSSMVGPRFMILLLTLEAVGTGEVLTRRRVALQTQDFASNRGASGREIPRGLEGPPSNMYRPPRDNHRSVMTPARLASLNALDCILSGAVMSAYQLGVSRESFVARVQQLYTEMGMTNPVRTRTQ